MEYTYEGLVRYSFGFSNPNHAAALFAMLIPLMWGLRRIFTSRLAFICILIPEIILYLTLIATISRTGIAAVILGGALFFYLTHKHWGIKLDRKSLLLTFLIVAASFTILLAAGMLKRHYSWLSSPPDDSMLNRLILWEGGLQMIADNPSGVGTGLSGTVFTDFLQPDGARLAFRTMVNSFLTFMVEQGVILSFLAAIPLFFSFIASFISLRCEMPNRRKFLIISLITSCFCAVLSGMFSTCFDFSVIIGCFSSGLPSLNSFLQLLLSVLAFGSFVILTYLPVKYLNPLQLKLALLASLTASVITAASILLTGTLLNSSKKDTCVISEKNSLRMATVSQKTNHDGRMLVLIDGKDSSRKSIVNFIRSRHEGYSIDFPLSSPKNPEVLFLNYEIVVLCEATATLAGSEAKTRFIFYNPLSFVALDAGKIEMVYLNQFDEYGCNRQWEKALSGHREMIQYLY